MSNHMRSALQSEQCAVNCDETLELLRATAREVTQLQENQTETSYSFCQAIRRHVEAKVHLRKRNQHSSTNWCEVSPIGFGLPMMVSLAGFTRSWMVRPANRRTDSGEIC